MCEALKIKIAIIQRYWQIHHYSMESIPPIISALLRTGVSYDLIRYVCLTGKDEIIRDIANGLPIALELDNLKLNWD